VLAELSRAQPSPQRRWGHLADLLTACERAAGNLSNEISRMHFSHADRQNKSLGA
jgi:hypothetical protein